MRWMKITFPLLMIAAAAFFLWAYPDKEEDELRYWHNQGHVFGTYYNIRYSAPADLQEIIEERLAQFDASLSTFNPASVISRINTGVSDTTDLWFEQMYATAQRVSGLSNGAFDITVAPLVNAWGFGFRNKQTLTPARIDSLLRLTGYHKIRLDGHRLYKDDPRIMLDASAIAKGQACDVVADLLREKGCGSWLVDIGGEVVLHGRNDQGQPWRVGISKPVDDPAGASHALQQIVESTSLCMATSGNYRQFYYEDGLRRSHTIDPRTGQPVAHQLLSATVVAPSCMEADALATACMVLGTDSALSLITPLRHTECYLIEADSAGMLRTRMSPGMNRLFLHTGAAEK